MLYLAAVVDWFSRRVLSWRLSITMEAAFCIEVLDEALARHGRPDIFNTDQGSQFTSQAFTGVLIGNAIAISMDGKGSWRDNVFVERLWRTVKYEEVYLRAYETVSDARASIGRYLGFYNRASKHPSCYVIDEKRLCWLGCDPARYLGNTPSHSDCRATPKWPAGSAPSLFASRHTQYEMFYASAGFVVKGPLVPHLCLGKRWGSCSRSELASTLAMAIQRHYARYSTASCGPTTRREDRSTTAATYSHFSGPM